MRLCVPCVPSCVPSGRVNVYSTRPWNSSSPPASTRNVSTWYGSIRGVIHTAEVGGVRVHPVEVGRALDVLEFLGSELRQAIAEHLAHEGRVFAEIDRVLLVVLNLELGHGAYWQVAYCEPTNGDVERVLRSRDIYESIIKCTP